MEIVKNDNRLLLVATSHRNAMSISNTLVLRETPVAAFPLALSRGWSPIEPAN